ncbi:MAG TPA: hypothetical protein VGL52_10735 [Casimicrobiaceae bacterium]
MTLPRDRRARRSYLASHGCVATHNASASAPISTDYWKSIDAETGRRIEDKLGSGRALQPAEGMGER